MVQAVGTVLNNSNFVLVVNNKFHNLGQISFPDTFHVTPECGVRHLLWNISCDWIIKWIVCTTSNATLFIQIYHML